MYKVSKKFISTHGDNGQEYAVGSIIDEGTLPEGYVKTLKKLGYIEDNDTDKKAQEEADKKAETNNKKLTPAQKRNQAKK